MSSDEAARLQRLEDIAEIEGLIVDYARHLDARDLHADARLFCADGEWRQHRPRAGTRRDPGDARGAPAPQPSRPRHVVSNPVIDVDGDTATASVTWALIRRGADEDQPELALLGHYDDVLAREDGRWRFKSRRAHIDIPDRPVPS